MNLFENLSSEEKKLLSAYDEMAKSANFNRSDEEIFFDKISLLGGARLLVNTTRKGRIIDDEYIKTKIMQLKKKSSRLFINGRFWCVKFCNKVPL